MTMVITMHHRTKSTTMTSQSMKITLTKMMMKTKITTMKTMMMKITMMKIMTMTMKTTMTMIIEEEAEEDQETETSRETAREDLLPEAVEAVPVEDQDVVQVLDPDHREEEEIPAGQAGPDQDQEEEEDLQIHQTQIVTTMITDTIILEDREEAETEAEDLRDLVQVPAQIQEDQDQDQVAAEAAQDLEIMVVQVEVPIQDPAQEHQKEVLLL